MSDKKSKIAKLALKNREINLKEDDNRKRSISIRRPKS